MHTANTNTSNANTGDPNATNMSDASNASSSSSSTSGESDGSGESDSSGSKTGFYKSSYDPVEIVPDDIFPNFTTAALSVYLRISKTSRRDFSTLLKILQDPAFSQKDLPSSFKACRRYLRKLKSLPIQTRKVTSKNLYGVAKTIEINSYSIKDILFRALSTPSLASKMYFGPAVKVQRPKEFWHGSLWCQSPLFGESTVVVRGISA
jgi:hypothetical protein